MDPITNWYDFDRHQNNTIVTKYKIFVIIISCSRFGLSREERYCCKHCWDGIVFTFSGIRIPQMWALESGQLSFDFRLWLRQSGAAAHEDHPMPNELAFRPTLIIGAGGTGSAAIPVLARAGIGRIIAVDPDIISQSNLERVHGAYPSHVAQRTPKVQVASELVTRSFTRCRLTCLLGHAGAKIGRVAAEGWQSG